MCLGESVWQLISFGKLDSLLSQQYLLPLAGLSTATVIAALLFVCSKCNLGAMFKIRAKCNKEANSKLDSSLATIGQSIDYYQSVVDVSVRVDEDTSMC